jgi:hypothetical protein
LNKEILNQIELLDNTKIKLKIVITETTTLKDIIKVPNLTLRQQIMVNKKVWDIKRMEMIETTFQLRCKVSIKQEVMMKTIDRHITIINN